jgi:hypothetical protein
MLTEIMVAKVYDFTEERNKRINTQARVVKAIQSKSTILTQLTDICKQIENDNLRPFSFFLICETAHPEKLGEKQTPYVCTGYDVNTLRDSLAAVYKDLGWER